MKRKTLALALLCSGLTTGMAYAAEGDLNAAGTNSITLEGLINNNQPAWAWQVGDAQTDWDTQRLDWRVSGANATVNFTDKGKLTLLDGYVTFVIPKGGPGITPVITFTGDGYKESSSTANARNTELTAKGLMDPDNPDSVVEGVMTFKTYQGFLAAFTIGNTAGVSRAGYSSRLNTADSFRDERVYSTAYNNMKRSADWASTLYGGISFSPAAVPLDAAAFGTTVYGKLLGGYHAYADNFAVTFPTASLPATWTAALGITVAYQ